MAEGEREIRMEPEAFEEVLLKAGIINEGEAIKRVWIEPGELIITAISDTEEE